MASRKRAADRQITKDDSDEEESTEMGGTWKEAAPEKLAKRQIVKARRRGEKKEGGAAAAASEEKPAAAAMPVFDFSGGAAKPAEEKKEEEKKAEAKPGIAADNPLAKFLKKEGQWECPGCMLTNQPDKAKCVACETPNPKAEASGASSSAEDSVAAAGITFGAAPADGGSASSGLDKPLFSWAGGDSSSSSSAGTGTLAPPATEGGFSFGFNIASSGPVSFGGVAAAEGEGFKAPAADATTAAAAPAGDGKEEAKPFQLEAKPDVAAEFKDKKAESTGEEGDTIELKIHARVFQLKMVAPKAGQELPKREEAGDEGKGGSTAAAADKAEGKAEAAPADATPKPKFVEAGSGELHLNTYEKDGKKARLVLRVDRTQRLVLNAAVFPGMTWTHGKEDKSVRLVSTDLDGKMGTTWALKFKTKDDASTFAEKLGDVISSLQE